MTDTMRDRMGNKFRQGRRGHDTLTGFDFEQDPALGRQRAIHAKCFECQGGQQNEVTKCTITDCPLWPWRKTGISALVRNKPDADTPEAE